MSVGAESGGTNLNANDPIEPSYSTGGNFGYGLRSSTNGEGVTGKTNEVTLSVDTTITNVPTGGGNGHVNYQPGRGVYYIIYIP